MSVDMSVNGKYKTVKVCESKSYKTYLDHSNFLLIKGNSYVSVNQALTYFYYRNSPLKAITLESSASKRSSFKAGIFSIFSLMS